MVLRYHASQLKKNGEMNTLPQMGKTVNQLIILEGNTTG